MLKIPKTLSLYLSIAICVILFFVCIAGAFIMPALVDMLVDLPDNIGNRGDITQTGRSLVLILSYFILLCVLVADWLMFALLHRVKAGQVFTDQSVSLIRGVSWCCFLLGMAFCGLGIYFQLSFLVAFAAVFLGMCLRVVKNTIEEATQIKSENDLTV